MVIQSVSSKLFAEQCTHAIECFDVVVWKFVSPCDRVKYSHAQHLLDFFPKKDRSVFSRSNALPWTKPRLESCAIK
jgi:hypothetical protein